MPRSMRWPTDWPTPSGPTGSNEGIVKATAVTDATITAAIQAGRGQTLMAIYGIPVNKALFLTSVVAEAIANSSANAEITLLVKENADQAGAGFIVKEVYRLTETAPVNRVYRVPKKIQGPAIVKLQARTDAADTEVVGAFDGYLVNHG